MGINLIKISNAPGGAGVLKIRIDWRIRISNPCTEGHEFLFRRNSEIFALKSKARD